MSNTASDHPQREKKENLGPWDFYIALPNKGLIGALQSTGSEYGNPVNQRALSLLGHLWVCDWRRAKHSSMLLFFYSLFLFSVQACY